MSILVKNLQILSHDKSENSPLEFQLTSLHIRSIIPEDQSSCTESWIVSTSGQKQQIGLVKHADSSDSSAKFLLSDHPIALGGVNFIALGGSDSQTALVLVHAIAEDFFLGIVNSFEVDRFSSSRGHFFLF